MAGKPLKPLPSTLREKRLSVLERYNDSQQERQISDLQQQCDRAIASSQGASAASKVATASQVRAADAEESASLKVPVPPTSFVGAAGNTFLKKRGKKTR